MNQPSATDSITGAAFPGWTLIAIEPDGLCELQFVGPLVFTDSAPVVRLEVEEIDLSAFRLRGV
ncbi:hypothetical protein ACELLULO517_07555 [Acidisoma cellulosilytica]|uniref:Uncharacterized protein n=1 Tax=Acidisoma cellulosilyticum TaxID=2802395 RepID=A0A963YZS1_9PROT|nr:hypothetical protein [Acidisoma cellulosilyticum]MCB8880086.1 hypothetical protein [Acidisoma cellulosilyticum]